MKAVFCITIFALLALFGSHVLVGDLLCGVCKSALKKGSSANTAACFSESPLEECVKFCYAYMIIYKNDSTVNLWRSCVDEKLNDEESFDEMITLSATFEVEEGNCGTARQLFNNVSHLSGINLEIFNTFAETWTVSKCKF